MELIDLKKDLRADFPALNKKILDKKKLKKIKLSNGDKIEIVHFIGGG